ncbi:hypothetical protein V2J09_018458 [Rumex salicifolius]
MSIWDKSDGLDFKQVLMIRQNINIITWNAQGAGRKEFFITLKEIVRIHDPTILVLVETRISGSQADKVCQGIGFDGILRAEAIGFSGGISVLWRKAVIQIEEVHVHRQAVTVEVKRSGEDGWIFSAIYSSPTPHAREVLWNHLLNLKTDNSKPWLLMGDFNETSNLEERSSESDGMRRRCERFSAWIDEMDMIDLGYTGSKFTWTRGKDLSTQSAARLDRGLCNFEWRDAFPDASIKHLVRNQSDHSPLLLKSTGFMQRNPLARPFRFQAAWVMHEEFQSFMRNHWQQGAKLSSALANLATHLESWNRDVFGNLFRRRDRLWKRIEGIQRELCVRPNGGLMRLEQQLRGELDCILEQIHIFWVQKARTDVLKDGDRNTKFFHACAVVCRKRNRIEGLFDEAGIWHDNPSELRSMVVDHFKALFSEEGVRDGPIDLPREVALGRTVADYWDGTGWKWNELVHILSQDDLIKITAHEVVEEGVEDNFYWDCNRTVCGEIETSLHILRDCKHAKEVWGKFTGSLGVNWSNQMTVQEWIGNWISGPGEWPEIAGVAVWWVWKWRNSPIFGDGTDIPREKRFFIEQRRAEFVLARSKKKIAGGKLSRKGCWKPPAPGWVTLNTDGSFRPQDPKVGAGGLLRDHTEIFVQGFLCHKTGVSALHAEWIGVWHGLRMAKQKGVAKLKVECDSRIMSRCKDLINWEGWEVSICHVSRECNEAADWMAKESKKMVEDERLLLQPPEDMLRILFVDVNASMNN